MRITDEERRLLEAEGVYLPHDMPLTKVGGVGAVSSIAGLEWSM